MGVLVEACVDTIESAMAAARGGANRIELCANLIEGGTSPSVGTLRESRRRLDIPIHVLVRPRGGDFLYSEAEATVILEDIMAARDLGADGIVIGALTPDGDVDVPLLTRMMDAAGPMSITFHRAFDVTRDWKGALHTLASLGIDRVLTSGQARTAMDGTHVIAAMVKECADRVIMLAGGGIGPTHVVDVVRKTGVSEVHLTGAVVQESRMRFRAPHVEIGHSPPRNEYDWFQTEGEVIRMAVEALKARDGRSA